MVTRRKMPMKWTDGKPRQAGHHAGTIYGVPFDVVIFDNQLHSQRTTWSYDLDILDGRYTNAGESGGVQRALSNLRDDLETICDKAGIEAPA